MKFARMIGAGRIGWGMVLAVAPRSAHALGKVAYPGPDGGVWVRAFGVRDIALGVGAFHPDPAVRRYTSSIGVASDLADAVVVGIATRSGLPRRAAAVGVALAGGTALIALLEQRAA